LDEDDEKDEVDMAFALLKNHFRESDADGDEYITKQEFKKLLAKLDPRIASDENIDKIYSNLSEAPESKKLNFKLYLYGVYLFVTGTYK
jgi:Ca2+-binding EF-hand superfamily protein